MRSRNSDIRQKLSVFYPQPQTTTQKIHGFKRTLIEQHERALVIGFDDIRRSNALSRLVFMREAELFTEEEFARFSDETRGRVEELLQAHAPRRPAESSRTEKRVRPGPRARRGDADVANVADKDERALHPRQFEANEAWIVFRLNDAPVETESDGDFHVFALMDAASCHILGSEFCPVHANELPAALARRLLGTGQAQAPHLPKRLLIDDAQPARQLCAEAARLGVEVVCVAESALSAFTAEARASFKDHFGGGLQ